MAVKDTSFDIVDRCTLAYNAIVLAVVLLFHSRIPQWYLQVIPNVLMIGVAFLVVRFVGNRGAPLARALRSLYPLLFFFVMYGQTGRINHIVFPGFLDPVFCRIEAFVFGVQPAVMLAQWFPQKWLAEVLHFAYFSYYVMISGLGIFLYVRRDRTAFVDYMFALSCTMYVCYLIYIVLPVRGAVVFGLGPAPGGGPFSWMMAFIYRHFEVEGAAFPSSHVAISALVLVYTFRYARPAVWVVGPLVVSLMVLTVYCRYHYAIDVFAGLATAAVLIPIWRRINPELRKAAPTQAPGSRE